MKPLRSRLSPVVLLVVFADALQADPDQGLLSIPTLYSTES